MSMSIGNTNTAYTVYPVQTKECSPLNYTSRPDVRLAPGILKQMSNDPAVAAKYEKILSEIPAMDRWADSMIKSMTGSEVKYRQVWIDENGNMGSLCVTGPSEEQKKLNENQKTERKEQERRNAVKRLIYAGAWCAE